jgi:hypothetical protein
MAIICLFPRSFAVFVRNSTALVTNWRLNYLFMAGFAFVEMEDPRDAKDAVRGLDGTRICGTR